MRLGQNPARYIESVAQPADLTIAVVNFIPYLSGYYEQSLDVFKACLNSICEHTPRPFDLMVFDNNSCLEVREYLLEIHKQGKIQVLILSEQNVGKMGAWNYMFGAAQGKYVAFSDADIVFCPGWYGKSLELINVFPNVGMVTARPLRVPSKFSPGTLAWGRDHAILEEGQFQSWEVFWEHTRSLGLTEQEAQEKFLESEDYRLSFRGQQAYVGAAHFQFLAPCDVLKKILPIPSVQPMRGDRELDIAIDRLGYLRLTTLDPYVRHLGNRLPEDISTPQTKPTATPSLLRRFLWLPGIRHFLLWLHNQIFRLYFFNVE
jgi:glycosyltransferase involved in cell wall biosynthesis